MLDDNFTKKYPDIEELRRLLLVLKNNKDHIPVFVLKSKYKKGYNDLCDKIRCSASAYALDASLHGLKVHISYADEIATIVTSVIEGSGIMHQFSTAIYKNQDLDQFVKLTEKLREMILTSLSVYWMQESLSIRHTIVMLHKVSFGHLFCVTFPHASPPGSSQTAA